MPEAIDSRASYDPTGKITATMVMPDAISTPMTQPIIPGGPTWLSGKNLLIGGGVVVGAYVLSVFLFPPKKKAPVAGLGRLFKSFKPFKFKRYRRRR